MTVNYSIDLRLVSDLVGAPVDDIEALNPSLLRMVTPPERRSICTCRRARPRSSTSAFALIPEARRNAWRYHPVAAGDTLASVAQASSVQFPNSPRSISSAQGTASQASRLKMGRAHPLLDIRRSSIDLPDIV